MKFLCVLGAFRVRVDKSALVLLDKYSKKFTSTLATFQQSKLLLGSSVQKTIFRPKGIAGSAPGRGAGRGGGAGGTIRESGGGLGEYGTAQEEQYFFKKQRQQLEELKKKLKKEGAGVTNRKEDK